MSICSSPTSPTFIFGESKEIREAYQLHYITIPLARALHRANQATNKDPSDYQPAVQWPSPRMSLTPSLGGHSDTPDESFLSLPEAELVSPKHYSESHVSRRPRTKRRASRLLLPSCHQMRTRSQVNRHSMATFWELDDSGRKRRRRR